MCTTREPQRPAPSGVPPNSLHPAGTSTKPLSGKPASSASVPESIVPESIGATPMSTGSSVPESGTIAGSVQAVAANRVSAVNRCRRTRARTKQAACHLARKFANEDDRPMARRPLAFVLLLLGSACSEVSQAPLDAEHPDASEDASEDAGTF